MQNISDINTPDEDGWFPILRMCAACEGYSIVKLKKMIEQGANIHFHTPKGRTALHLSCATGKPNFIKDLLDAGAQIDVLDEDGCTPLYLAICGSNKSIDILIENGANKDIINNIGKSALYHACEVGKVGAVKSLCIAGANTKLLTPTGTSMVGLILDSGGAMFVSNTLQMMRVLIKAGVGVNNSEYETGDTEIIKAAQLIQIWSCAKGYMDPIKILIRAGANPWHRNKKNECLFDNMKDDDLNELKPALKKYIKGNEITIVKKLWSINDLKAFYFNQNKLSTKLIYEMLQEGSPAKSNFNNLKALTIQPNT